MPGSSAVQLRQHTANFNRVARLYRWAEYLTMGSILEQVREYFLGPAAKAHNAVLLGDGDGRFAAALLARAPHLQAVAVDSSKTMLALLCQRCRPAGDRLHVVHGSLTRFPLHVLRPSPDLIVSHFVLDCLTQAEVDDLAERLSRHVQPGCQWLVSDFALPARQPWKLLGWTLIRFLYLAFRVLTGLSVQQLPKWERSLSKAGFRQMQGWSPLGGLLTTQLWQKQPSAAPSSDHVIATGPAATPSTLE